MMSIAEKVDFTFPPEWVELGNQTIKLVNEDMIGRIADEQDGTLKMAIAACSAGGGDHLEIGTLFGGSAIVVALMKRIMGFAGKVICLDPLDGFYRRTLNKNNDPLTQLPINIETVKGNIKLFGVEDRIEIIQRYSHPFPEILKDHLFASAYIDGEHHGQGPMNDWLNVNERVTDYVIFDNCDSKHPAVERACDYAGQDKSWVEVYRGGITCILERI